MQDLVFCRRETKFQKKTEKFHGTEKIFLTEIITPFIPQKDASKGVKFNNGLVIPLLRGNRKRLRLPVMASLRKRKDIQYFKTVVGTRLQKNYIIILL